MSKILAQGMITLTQLYEGAQVILTPTAVLIPCDSKETPKSNAYTNAFTNVKAFLGTMDITSKITLGTLEYSDSTVRASKSGTKVSITAITTRTGYVDIPVSVAIDGETINLGKHRFSFVKQIDGQTGQPGQPGIPGDPGFSYTLNIKGGTRGIAYAANGTNPEPKTSSQFSVELLKNGVKIANPASISWTCGGNLSGSSSAATFTPTIKSTYNSESSYVKVSVKEFAASLAVEETIPIVCTKHADGLDWINEWNNKYVQVGTEKIITPKIFAGTKSSANELTGVAIGRDVLGGNANKVIGIVGYKKNTPVFSLDQNANFFVSSSGSAGDIKNGTNNAKGIYFDGNNLYVSGKVKISGGSTIGESNTLVEDVINNSNLGAQANNKLDNLSIGGRNLAQKTSNIYSTPFTDFNGGTNKVVMITNKVLTDGLAVGDMVSVRLVYKYDNIVAAVDNTTTPATTKTAAAWIQGSGNVTSWDSGSFYSSPKKTLSGSGEHIFSYSFKMTSNHLKNDYWSINIRHDNVQSGSVQFKMFKVEKGSMPTDWTPAPEDLENAYTIILTNEAQVIPTNSSRKPTSSVTYSTDIQVYKGSTQRTDYTIGTINSANGITVSKTSSRVNFAVSTGTALTADGGYFTIPIAIDGKTFNKTFSWSCSKQGVKGDTGATGNGISGITEYYAVSSSNTTAPTSWSTTVPAMTATNKYLWNYETITYSNNTTTNTLKRVIGVYGDKGNTGNTGATGNGISGITNYYLASPKSSGITTSTSGWTTSVQSVSSSKKYLWNYEAVAYTNGSTNTTTPCIIGVYGDKGDNAKTVSLTSSSQVFKSTDGGLTFAPDNIVITPNYQNVSYSKWQYSTNGGNSWTDVSSSTNGVTYSSTSLTLSKTSTLFTNTATSIIFKIITNNSSVTDTITIVKLYDVTDLQIGGRNLIRKGDLAQNNSTATYNGATNTWTVNAIAGAGGTWGCGLVVKNGNALVPYGKAYVLSFEIKVPRACSWNCDVNNYASTGSNWAGNDNDNTSKRTTSSKSLVANQWIKCWIKWENTNSNNTNKVDIYDNTNFGVVMKDETSNITYQIRNVKGELGNVPTEWTPAPEDIQADIDKKANNSDVYKKTETYTKTQTDSAIEVAKDEINLGVSSTYETKTNVENKISSANTNTLNSAKSYADAKKNEAISSASTDATNKVNSAKTELTNKIDNIEVGGRNLALGTKTATGDVSAGTYGTLVTATDLFGGVTAVKTNTMWSGRYFNLQAIARRGGFKVGDKLVLSVYIKSDSDVTLNVSCHRTTGTGNTSGSSKTYKNFTVTPKWKQVYFPFIADDGTLNRVDARIEVNTTTGTNNIYWAGWQLEKGTNASDWTIAPEDLDTEINKKANSVDVYNKSETYTKSETDSKINISKEAIELGVKNTYETKTNVETKISSANTTTLNSAKSYADTKKNEAISSASNDATTKANNALNNAKSYADTKKNEAINSASTDATNKVNSAKNELNTAINKKANSADVYKKSEVYTKSQTDSAINVAKDAINLSVSQTYETKSNVETKVNNAVTGLKVGGNNLLRNGNFAYNMANWSVHDTSSGGTSKSVSVENGGGDWKPANKKVLVIRGTNTTDRYGAMSSTMKLTPNTKYTISGYCAGHRVGKIQVNVRDLNASSANIFTQNITPVSGGSTLDKWHRFELGFTTTSRTDFALNLYSVNFADNGYVWFSDVQIQEGTKATAWTPCSEDIDSSINSKANSSDVYKKTETYTKSETDSKINISKEAIELGVKNTYETKTIVETKISSANTNTLNSAKSYADTKKNEAISSASADATNKVNSAKTELNTAISKKANSADVYKKTEVYTKSQTDSAINVAKDAINLSVSNTYETKTNVTSKINTANTNTLNSAKSYADTKKTEAINSASADATNKVNSAKNELNTAINKIQVGGRNLLRNSSLSGINFPHNANGYNWRTASVSETSTVSRTRVKISDCPAFPNGIYGIKFVNTSGTSQTVDIAQDSITVEDGQEYTMSAYLKVASGSGESKLQYGTSPYPSKTESVGSSWVKRSYTFTYSKSSFGGSLKTNIYFGIVGSSFTGYACGFKIEKGNKATDWSPSPEDTQADIDAKANTSDVYTKSQTDAQITASTSGISSKVTTLENTTTKLNNSITNHENRLKTAESKITNSAIINTVSSTINTAKNEAINSANTNTTNQLKNYVTSSTFTQTTNNITASFKSSGGNNLLRNSSFNNANGWFNYWGTQRHNNPTGYTEKIEYTADWGFPDPEVSTSQIRVSNQSGIEYGLSQSLKTMPNKKYTISFYYASHRITSARVIVRGTNGSWLSNKEFNPSTYSGGKSSVGNWGMFEFTFTSNATSHTINIVVNTAGNDCYMWIAKPMVNEGDTAQAWTPHKEEIINGSTTIDGTGITVKNGGLRVKDGSGNMMLEGDSSGTLYLRKQLNVGTIGTFSPSGVSITGGKFSVSGGTAYNESSTGYLEGSTTSQSLYKNGLYGSSSMTSGSQIHRSNSFYGTNGWSIYEDNSANATQQSFKSYSRGSGIYIQATETDKGSANVGKLVEKTRLNHEGLRTTGSITASKGVNADTLNSRTLRSSANTNNRIDLQSHNNDMWFRSTSEYFTFQCGTGGDNWTQSFGIRGVNSPAEGQNANWIDIGQMKSNASNGSYRGVSIRKYANGGATAGDLIAGRYYMFGSENAYLTNHSNTGIKIQSPHGYCAIGPQNGSYCHYVTDRPTHWFDRNVAVQGEIRCGSGYNQLVPYGLMSNGYDNGTGEVCEGRIHIGGNKYIYYGWCSVHATAGTSAERTYTVPNLKRIRGITIQCYTKGGTGNFGELALKQTYSNGFTFRLYNATNTGTHYVTYMIIGE